MAGLPVASVLHQHTMLVRVTQFDGFNNCLLDAVTYSLALLNAVSFEHTRSYPATHCGVVNAQALCDFGWSQVVRVHTRMNVLLLTLTASFIYCLCSLGCVALSNLYRPDVSRGASRD